MTTKIEKIENGILKRAEDFKLQEGAIYNEKPIMRIYIHNKENTGMSVFVNLATGYLVTLDNDRMLLPCNLFIKYKV